MKGIGFEEKQSFFPGPNLYTTGHVEFLAPHSDGAKRSNRLGFLQFDRAYLPLGGNFVRVPLQTPELGLER